MRVSRSSGSGECVELVQHAEARRRRRPTLPLVESESSRIRHLGRVGLHTALVDNSAAFGFSVTITASYGALNQLTGQPSIADIVGFGAGAGAAFTLLQAAATRGFRNRPTAAPREVILLGTALDILSIALGLTGAVLAALLLPAGFAWPAGAFLAAVLFTLAQALELTIAAQLERRLGDPEADPGTPDGRAS